MNVNLLRIFQYQVLFQSEAALSASHAFIVALEEIDGKDVDTVVTGDVWVAIQNLLSASGNISKALWGSGGRHAEARRTLRESLKVADDSPLREVVLRNHLEHYDERIDRWWETSKQHHYLDMAVLDLDTVYIEDADAFRVLDPDTLQVIFWGERFDLPGLIEAVSELQTKAVEQIKRIPGHPVIPPK